MSKAEQMAADYRRYQPLMLGTLGRLAQQGSRVAPGDALDLIHEFFVSQWERVRSTYDPQRGSFSALLFTSFYRFARTHIARETRMQAMLFMASVDAPTVQESSDLERSVDLKALETAIYELPLETQRALQGFFCNGERSAARAQKLSRYSLRERVIEGLGRIAVSMNLYVGLDDRQWTLARMLWVEQRSELDIQASLKMSRAQFLRARRALVTDIAATLLSTSAGDANERKIENKSNETMRYLARSDQQSSSRSS